MSFEDVEVVKTGVGADCEKKMEGANRHLGAREGFIPDEHGRADDATGLSNAAANRLEAVTAELNELQVAARADLHEWRVERERMATAERARGAAITAGDEAKQPHDQQKWLEKFKAELLTQVREAMRDIADRTDELAASAIRERALEKSLRKLTAQLAKQPPADPGVALPPSPFPSFIISTHRLIYL